jgi:prepilin-type N-terminal cleavage/methylation domain-containing protein
MAVPTTRRISRPAPSPRAGITLIEMVIVVVVLGILAAAGIPKITELTARNKADQATAIVERDLERAFAIAGRLRQSVNIVANNGGKYYQVVDASGGSVRLNRRLFTTDEYGVQTMTFSPTTVTVRPNGTSDGPLTVTLVFAGATRQITMTRVGLVRRTQ